ncbi:MULTISPECIES: hypothetical protein [Streptomyces]|uniref:hypothetical protein n=1 Tax=Streptomyces TaxID=1883 RepID=UPI00224882F9|nr:hypothetical protein [Streptomyces sp. JHD 1]MCX2971029.1 hypothetical protein [Streptomyces sp. JHD 1]
MPRHTPPRPLLRAASALAAAGLLAVGVTGTAHAADEPLPVTITGPDRVDLSLHSDNGDPTEPQIELGLTAPDDGTSGPDEDGITYPVHQGAFQVTIDASGLAGVADVELPCAAEGLVAVCDGHEVYAGDDPGAVGRVRVDVNDDSAAGDLGTIEVTGEGEGLAFTGRTIEVLVGGAELRMRQLTQPDGFAPGDTLRAPLGFRNVGGLDTDGVVLSFHGSRGLSFPGSYGNCAYAHGGDTPATEQTHVLCSFEGTYAAGATYEVSEPVAVRTADFAFLDLFGYRFTAMSSAEARDLRAARDYEPGTGAPLELTRVTGGDSAVYESWAELDFPTDSSYDLAFTGDAARGGAGETVRLEAGFANHGPAWFGALRSGEPLAFHVEIPEGASVVRAAEGCNPLTQSGESSDSLYLCWLSTPIVEDDARTFPFELRIDEVVENARGKISLGYVPPHDGDDTNDEAYFVLNGAGGDTSGGGSGGPGTGGSSGGSSGGGDTGGSAGTGGGDTDGAAGDGGTGGQGGADAEGDLALTGSGGVFVLGGGALVALLAGGAAFLAVRRRTAARTDAAA